MNTLFITPADSRYPEELELRFRVLREPLGQRREDVPFPFERESLHLIAEDGEALAGCVLFHPESLTQGRLFQMAVAPNLQRLGLGRRLVERLEGELRERGFTTVTLHARVPVVGFYQKLGYAVEGEVYEEVGIPHQNMRKDL